MSKNSSEKAKKNSASKAVFLRLMKNPIAIIGIVLILVLCLAAIFAPFLTQYDPAAIDILAQFQTPSLAHLCGTDDLGRDIFTRLLYGGRYSITIGVVSVVSALIIGVILGSISGYFGGQVDNIMMRILDVIQALPSMLFAIIISAVLGAGFVQTIIALSVTTIPAMARMMRANILSVREMEYIEAAQSIKCSNFRIIVKHVIPNAMSPMIVTTASRISANILMATGLSYIGLGVQPPTSEWGAMLTAGRNYITLYPHLVLFPGLFICLFTLGFNLFGDALRDALDPTLKQ
ncbi:MAG: ABC transporter permease [Lachnospiraceae bacterium]|nr:ABC transporter permease [Lachnospiraceae bacterium]